MSLEKAIEANTAALVALTAAISVAAGNKTAPAPATTSAATAPKEKPAEKQPEPSSKIDYEKDVKPLALQVAQKKGRDTLLNVLGKFSAANAQVLKPEQYADFIKACNEALK